ncbi:MAG: hypothetical protein FVQ82_11730 [Planctomycetes bacterium]|nr:hypothetical protein [Planctomycetota bacterium]
MEPINRQSKTSIHFSMSYAFAMPWSPEKSKTLDFQKALLDNGLEFSQINTTAKQFTLFRAEHSPLRVVVESNGPQVCSLHVVAQNPTCDLDMFTMDASAVCSAFMQTWPADQYQVVRRAAKIHHLYSCNTHAFGYLWEKRLGQSPGDFKALGGRPVAGGGLRLVMPPTNIEGQQPNSIEVRIESFMRETTKLFIETAIVWPKPTILQKDEKLDPQSLMQQTEDYATNEVWNFLTQ